MASHKKDKHALSNSDKKSAILFRSKGKQSSIKKIDSSASSGSSPLRRLIIIFLAIFFGVVHYDHVSTLFENDRHFSHLSTLEREMTFRSEMGMYYSYFKTIVEATTFTHGFHEIIKNNLTEYPSTINTLERFNLLPEVVLGGLFRILKRIYDHFGLVGRQCYRIERGQGMSPIDSCEGILQPEYFYLEAVWICAGLTASLIFAYGLLLSDSIMGGIIAIMCFLFNHGECTRVQWTPPLRESFAYPFCLLQMYIVCVCISANHLTNDETVPNKQHKIQVASLAVVTTMCLTMWQFSQFLMATQVIAVLILFTLGFLSRFSVLVVLLGQVVAVVLTLLVMFGNELLLSSLLTCLLLASVFTLVFLYPIFARKEHSLLGGFLSALIVAALTIVLKTRAFTTNQDAHIINILKAKLTSFRDFHTLLYICSAEFDFLAWESIEKLTKSWLLPLVAVVLTVLALQWCLSSDKRNVIEPEIVYSIVQLCAFSIMAVLIMRLKMFFTPQLCIIASLAASRKYFCKIKSAQVHCCITIALLAGMSVTGMENLMHQHSIMGEYSNFDLEQALLWIRRNTPPTAAFAGPMPITAAILLSTRRPIINHPHYEDASLRERTKKVYSAFSRKPPEEVFKILSSLQAEYIIISNHWCFPNGRPGCRMIDIWDIEEPGNKDRPPTCPYLFLGPAFPFHRVFSNMEYAILRLQPPYVELKGFNKY